jgi:hypothetical protein
MTFKHIAFNESETMRELSRIAIDKKMIKPSAPIIKEASAPDYSVSTSLTQNILKLCSGLRANGLSKYADEVESKFITYKKAAQECYNVSGEEGTDLVNAAHPEGSHQLVDVPGDSLVETIIDRQLADLKTIDKEPKGKLGTTKDIIKEVKRALGQETKNIDYRACIDSLNQARSSFDKAKSLVDAELSFFRNIIPLTNPVSDSLIDNPTQDGIKKASNYISYWFDYNKSRVSNSQKLLEIERAFNNVKLHLFDAGISLLRAENPQSNNNEDKVKEMLKDISLLSSEIIGFASKKGVYSNKALSNWCARTKKEIEEKYNEYATATKENREDNAVDMLSAFVQILRSDIEMFKNKYGKYLV